MPLVLVILIVLGIFFLFSITPIVIDLLIMLLIWGVIGWLAGKLLQGRGFGTVNNILLGLVGGILGGILFGLLNIPDGGLIMRIISGVVGSVALVWIGRLVQRG